MPTVNSIELPPPKNWQEFEDITRDALKSLWQSPNLQKHGRAGQAQHGVDIYGADYLGRLVGIQCKKYKAPLTLKIVREEILNAEKFKSKLSTLILATSTEHDAVLQTEVRAISEERALQGKFAVGIMFWGEIIAGLALNPASVAAHYPGITIQRPIKANSERQLAALELGYFGASIWEYVALIYGEAGWTVQADPDELIAKLRILAYRAEQLLPAEDAQQIVSAIESTKAGCLKKKSKQSDWDTVEVQATRASKRIIGSTAFLALDESRVLDVALQLGQIYHRSDDVPAAGLQSQIKEKLLCILGSDQGKVIDEAFCKADEKKSGYGWATRVYGFLDRKIRYQNQ